MKQARNRSYGFVTCSIALVISAFICLSLPQTSFAAVQCREAASAAEEKDNIYTLLAYAVVFKDWQNGDMEHNRGYNIGSVLVDPKSNVVYWARNSVNVTKNSTQHGEVRLMTCYLGQEKTKSLKGYTIYTTLEPCAMCSGMMMLASVPRTVYGETDPGYGSALERLELDTSRLRDGYVSYPRFVSSVSSIVKIRCTLDALYDKYRYSQADSHITDFLATDEVRKVYTDALELFLNYKVKYPENQSVLVQAQAFYKTVSDKNVPCCSEGCP